MTTRPATPRQLDTLASMVGKYRRASVLLRGAGIIGVRAHGRIMQTITVIERRALRRYGRKDWTA
jgi:hypothetical protein